MGNVQSVSVEYLQENSFRVVIDGTDEAGTFTKAGPLMKAKADVVSLRTGTSLTEESKEPGNVTYEPVVLEQGVSKNQKLRQMWNEVSENGGQSGSNNPGYKHIIRIEQLSRDKTTVIESYTYENAWISEFDDGGFDAESSKNRIRMCKFEYLGKPIYKQGE